MTKKFIPYGRQSISEEDIKAVVDALRSDWLTQGPGVVQFEKAVAGYCGAKYAVAVNSATSALHISCLSAGLGPGDVLWTSPNTFVASANCGLYCGASVDFVDIDPRTYNISVDALAQKLEKADRDGGLPKVLIPVHFAGQSCEMDRIARLAGRYGFKVIEDASHAIGGRYRETKVGSCAFSAMTVFSFHPVKIITTGEGGMIATNSPEFYEKLMMLRTHGITKMPGAFKNKEMAFDKDGAPNPWYYEMQEAGFNYRLTDIQSALGLSQLKKLDAFVSRRRAIAGMYNAAFKDMGFIKTQAEPEGRISSFHLYAVQMDFKRLGKSRARVMAELKDKGVGSQVHYIPVHLQPFYRERFGYKAGDYPVAEAYYEMALSLPMYPLMTDEDVGRVVEAVRGIAGVA